MTKQDSPSSASASSSGASGSSETPQFFGIHEAAAYCGLAVRTLKYHVYKSEQLKPDKLVGHSLIFTQQTLDDFLANRRPPHRPKGSKNRKPTPATDSPERTDRPASE